MTPAERNTRKTKMKDGRNSKKAERKAAKESQGNDSDSSATTEASDFSARNSEVEEDDDDNLTFKTPNTIKKQPARKQIDFKRNKLNTTSDGHIIHTLESDSDMELVDSHNSRIELGEQLLFTQVRARSCPAFGCYRAVLLARAPV